MASLLPITIKKEDDVVPRPSIIPKRKAAIVNIPPRARFAKARPNIGGVLSKAAKETQPSETEKKSLVLKEAKSNENTEKSQLSNTDSSSGNGNVQALESDPLVLANVPLKKEPEISQRPSVLAKRSLALPAAPRARYQKARPNIAALANKTSKSGIVQKNSGRVSTNEKENVTASPQLKASETQGDLGKESGIHFASGEKPIKNAESVKGFSFSKGEIEIFPEASFEESMMPDDVIHDDTTKDKSSCEIQDSSIAESSSLTNEKQTYVQPTIDYVVLDNDEEDEIFESAAKLQEKQEKNISNYSKGLSQLTTKSTCEIAKESPPTVSVVTPSVGTHSVNKLMEYPTLKSILNSPRKRTTTKKTYERKRRLAYLSETPSRSEMTMTDLIYFNPTGEPMKVSKPQTCAVENLPADENTKPVEEEQPEEDESSNAPVPKVIINENGEIIIDESSLVVRRKETIDTSIEAIIENDNTTYSSFRKKSSRQWTNKETSKFYKALSLVGTDFALMENIFCVKGKITRSRRELKLKFKREEKFRIELVHRAMYETQTYDLSILDEEDPDDPSAENVDDPSEIPVAKKRGRKPKVAGDENQPTSEKRKKKSNKSAIESTTDETDEVANGVLNDDSNEESCSRTSEVISDAPEQDNNEEQISKTKEISRPQRVRKTKVLSDYVIDVDDSENSDDYISETNCETIVRNKDTTDYSESIENIDNNGQSLPIKKPVKVRKRKSPKILPEDYFESSDAQDASDHFEVECVVTDVSRLGRIRRAKVLTDFITDEIELKDEESSDDESVKGVGKRRKVQALSEDSSEECFDEQGENCIMVEHIDCLPETLAMEVIERVKEESEELPELVMQQEAMEDNQDVVFLAATGSSGDQCSSDLLNNHRILKPPVRKNTEANNSYETHNNVVVNSQSSNHKQSPEHSYLDSNKIVSSSKNVVLSSKLVERNGNGIGGTNVSQVQCIDLEQPINDNVINLMSDAVSEVVITGSTKAKRMRRRAAAPNLARGKQRPKLEVEVPHIQPSFSNFTPAEEQSSPPKEIKTYSRNTKGETQAAESSSSLQADHTASVEDPGTFMQDNQTIPHPGIAFQAILDQGTSLEINQMVLSTGTLKQNNQTILDAVTSMPNSQAITLDSDTADPPPMMIFTKSPNNENILHLFMVSPKHSF